MSANDDRRGNGRGGSGARGGPGARTVTRRLFLAGGLKATIAAGVTGRMSIRDVLAAANTPAPAPRPALANGGAWPARNRTQSESTSEGEHRPRRWFDGRGPGNG